jgi:hypothetical protein
MSKSMLATAFFVITFTLNSGYACTIINDTPALLLLLAGIIVLAIGNLPGRVKKYRGDLIAYGFFALLALSIFLSFVAHADFGYLGGYAHQLAVIACAVLFTRVVPFYSFAVTFKAFMNIVTILSIMSWTWVNLIGLSLPLPKIESTAHTYFNGLLFFVFQDDPSKLMGPFWEAGLYASMAIYAIILTLYIAPDKKKPITIPIMLIGILLTASTAGYTLLLMVFIMWVSKKHRGRGSVFAVAFLMAILSLVVIYYDEIIIWLSQTLPDVFGKMLGVSYSRSTRLNGPIVDLTMFVQEPLLGVGMGEYLRQWPLIAAQFDVESRTSTITYFLANYGVLSIAFLLLVIRASFGNAELGLNEKVCLLAILLSILSKEPHYFNLVTLTLLCYLANSDKRPRFANTRTKTVKNR